MAANKQTNKYWILFVMYTQASGIQLAITTYHEADCNSSGHRNTSNIFNSINFFSSRFSTAPFCTYVHLAPLFMFHKYFDRNILYTNATQVQQTTIAAKNTAHTKKSNRVKQITVAFHFYFFVCVF